MTLRQQLVEQRWRPDLVERCIPLSDGIKPLDLLTGGLGLVQGAFLPVQSIKLQWHVQLLSVCSSCL
jgi:hypothetical protein